MSTPDKKSLHVQVPQGFLTRAAAGGRLTRAALSVLLILIERTHRFHGRDGGEIVKIGYRDLAVAAHVSRRSVPRAVDLLEGLGYVEVKRGHGHAQSQFRVRSRDAVEMPAVSPLADAVEMPAVSSHPANFDTSRAVEMPAVSPLGTASRTSQELNLKKETEILDDRIHMRPSKDAVKMVMVSGETFFVEDAGRIWRFEGGHYTPTNQRLVRSKRVDAGSYRDRSSSNDA